MSKILIAAIAIFILSGCATSPLPYADAKPVSNSNRLEGYSKYSKPKEGAVRVIIVRDSGMLGVAGFARLSIDSIDVADFWSSQRLELFIMPDDYIFALKTGAAIGGGALVERGVQIKDGKSYAFRISYDGAGSFSLQQSTQLQ